jgi:predicted membrane-bound spermidine synthase
MQSVRLSKYCRGISDLFSVIVSAYVINGGVCDDVLIREFNDDASVSKFIGLK